ncbi:uncharacterized protein LOC110422541 [Herrania umbratica]|uniref:Uncharacterized protein LOC110422541 n=1 Tax=Herrania umbratica TaxID=108875 RepID=A0A6J1AYW6_9ROSI|nr:uncharacterized protein LOC110422541 [Herrania umbratica]
MKKKLEVEDDGVKDLEIIKAVAQAWHSHSGCTRQTNEYDAYRRNFKGKPSRFKLEAMSRPSSVKDNVATPCWDFRQSLWDSYEIVTVAKKLETGLVFDDPFTGLEDMSRAQRKHKESKNGLRNLFKWVTSRRFNEADIPRENRNGF